MKTISVEKLREDPTQMLKEVEQGHTYFLTRNNQIIARIEPPGREASFILPKKHGPADTSALPRVELPDGMTIDDLLEEMKGEW